MNSAFLLSSKRLICCLQSFQCGRLVNHDNRKFFSSCFKYHVSSTKKTNRKYLQIGDGRSSLLKVNSYLTNFKRKESTETNKNSQNQKVLDEMSIRLLNENGFLSWCRNAYLCTAVGLAMISETSTPLGQTAGAVAIGVGCMNIFWGTSCHVTNLLRLRNVTGMSNFFLFLNVCGSMLHCCLWLMVLVCYIGFVDEKREAKEQEITAENEASNDV